MTFRYPFLPTENLPHIDGCECQICEKERAYERQWEEDCLAEQVARDLRFTIKRMRHDPRL